jgi:hypothetical protein
MAKSSAPFTNFTAGELSAKLDGRTDLNKYYNGCKKLQNFLTFPQGGVTRRPGTEFIASAPTPSQSASVRLIPFEFNVEQTYVLEFSNLKFRIYKDGAIVGGGTPIEVTTEYTAAQLAGLKFTQSADIMYIVHPDHKPKQIARTSDTAWTITDIEFRRGPLLDSPLDGSTVIADGRTGSVTITASPNTVFSFVDVGRIIKLHDGYAEITSVAADLSVTATVLENEDFREELMPSYTATTISFHEGDPDATGLAHNDFIEDSAGNFITEGFKVGMRISGTGSANIDISSMSVASRIKVTTDGPHNLIDGDLIKLTGVTGVTMSFPSGATINDFFYEVEVEVDSSGDPVPDEFYLIDPITRKDATGSGTPGVSSAELVNGNNFSGALIVSVTDSIITLSTSNDLHFQNEGQSITLTGDLIADDEYQLGAFSDRTGFPSCIAFFEQRLVFASTASQPQTLFFSVSGDFTNFTAGVADDSSLIYTIGSNQVNVIRYLTSSRVLLVGTSGGEFAVRAGSVDAPITPLNTQIKQQARYGSADIQPLVIGATALFVQREQRKLRELVYNFDVDGYVAPDMTLLAEHITEGKIKEMAYQQEPNNVVWCALEDGKLAAMTYRREEDVVAWHEHQLGGSLSTVRPYGFVESVAVISSSTPGEEEVYLAVQRDIDGDERRQIERLKPIDFGSDIKDAYFLDSGVTKEDITGFTVIDGLDHLDNETVSILADGAIHADKRVISGSVTLDRTARKAHAGLPYDSILQTMRIEAGGTEGTAQAKNKRISDIDIRVLNSVGAKIGPSEDNLDLIPFRDASMAMDKPVPLYTGDKFIEFPGGYNDDGFVVVKQDQPLPLTILSIYPRLQTFDR